MLDGCAYEKPGLIFTMCVLSGDNVIVKCFYSESFKESCGVESFWEKKYNI